MSDIEFWRSPVDLGYGRSLPLIELIESWAAHVVRLHSEATQEPGSDPWGVHDVAAALHIRDGVERGLSQDGNAVPAIVQVVDNLYRSFTTPDPSGLLQAVTDPGTGHTGWWWQRVPRSGPAAKELASIAERMKVPDKRSGAAELRPGGDS